MAKDFPKQFSPRALGKLHSPSAAILLRAALCHSFNEAFITESIGFPVQTVLAFNASICTSIAKAHCSRLTTEIYKGN
jgi:hypothetical protein